MRLRHYLALSAVPVFFGALLATVIWSHEWVAFALLGVGAAGLLISVAAVITPNCK
jgi:hypothetical protein